LIQDVPTLLIIRVSDDGEMLAADFDPLLRRSAGPAAKDSRHNQ
jgi:hypothetical protein